MVTETCGLCLEKLPNRWAVPGPVKIIGRTRYCEKCFKKVEARTKLMAEKIDTIAAEVSSGYGFASPGKDVKYVTGAVREEKTGKGRYDLLSPEAIRRLSIVLEKGAVRYGDRNWEQGLPPHSFLDSALRHTFQLLEGKTDEDHAAHAMWNLMAYIHTKAKEVQDVR